jgi:cobalt/nickel transport system permease protein
MINFSIPGTGSSGHLGGGLILAVLLGPYAAFLVIASVLTVQALFFADGGLLALGCNIFNMGFYPAFIAYPFIYRIIARNQYGTPRAWLAAIAASVVALQLGAFSVVIETRASGIAALPFGTFILMMLPIHLAIGIVEGLATAAVVAFVAHARPAALPADAPRTRMLPVLAGILLAAVIIGGSVSWFASTHPDGLEWSIAQMTGHEEVAAPLDSLHERLARVQERTALLPDYGVKPAEAETPAAEPPAAEGEAWPAVSAGTSLSGLLGGLLTLVVAGCMGFALAKRHKPA